MNHEQHRPAPAPAPAPAPHAQGVTIAFSPSGVRCPQRGGAQGGVTREEEPYWEEAAAFTRAHVLQRDVELEVESVDKAGTFLGTLRVVGGTKPLNLGGEPGGREGGSAICQTSSVSFFLFSLVAAPAELA